MTNTAKPVDALRAHKSQSQASTHFELEKALRRLINDKPLRVAKGKKITSSLVAKEAGINRSTLYRYHEPILMEIRRINQKSTSQQLKAEQSKSAQAKSKEREYRDLLEAAQADLERIAQENYVLLERNRELESLLRLRDEIIENLRQQNIQRSSIIKIR